MSVGPGRIRVFRANDKEAQKSVSSTRGKSVSSRLTKASKPEARVHRVDANQIEERVVANSRKVTPSNTKDWANSQMQIFCKMTIVHPQCFEQVRNEL